MRKAKQMLKRIKQSRLEPLRQRCEVYARVVGYLRPINQWNEGKMAEYKDRKMFKLEPEQIRKPDRENFNQDEYPDYVQQEQPNYEE